jgi:hypothetical protein
MIVSSDCCSGVLCTGDGFSIEHWIDPERGWGGRTTVMTCGLDVVLPCCCVGQDVGRLAASEVVRCGVKVGEFSEATGVVFALPRLHRDSAHTKQEPTLDEEIGVPATFTPSGWLKVN